ncbi:MAG: hypothetical protein PUK49_01045 [Oscillospiraceae bacterium]|nr:hypothetical protein [Oscillospiraceae bacterium]
MTTVIICPKKYEYKLCGRRLSDFAIEKIKRLGGDIVCTSDKPDDIRNAVKHCRTLPVLIYPVNILTAADLLPLVSACRKGYDMAVLKVMGDPEQCVGIIAVNRLPVGFDDICELYAAAIRERFNIKSLFTEEYCTVINSREDYLAAQQAILSGEYIPDTPYEDNELKPRYTAYRGLETDEPVYIGRNCVLGENVKLSRGTYIGDNVYIGSDTEIIRSAVMDGAYISGGAYLENVIVEENAAVAHGQRESDCTIRGKRADMRSAENIAPLFGTDGKMNGNISAAAAYSAGQAAAAEKSVAVAYGDTAAAAACEAFAAGAVSCGGNVTDFGELPENVFRYALRNSMCSCGVYFGYEYIRPWNGDGLPSEEKLRKSLENAVQFGGNIEKSSVDCGLTRADNVYDSYNSYIDKLIVSDISGFFADITTPNESLYNLCRSFTERHGADDRSKTRIAFHISGDGSRISAFTEETGYVFHERLVMLCLSRMKKSSAAVSSRFPHAAEKIMKLERFDYAPDYSAMTPEEVRADKKARANAEPALFDGVAVMAMVLNILASEDISLEEAVSKLPKYSSSGRMIPLQTNAAALFRRLGLPPRGGALPAERGQAEVRPMRTGGVILYAESASAEISAEICGFYEEMFKRTSIDDL